MKAKFEKCPFEHTLEVDGVYLKPNQEVVWHFFYSNGEKKCYAYTIRDIINKHGNPKV